MARERDVMVVDVVGIRIYAITTEERKQRELRMQGGKRSVLGGRNPWQGITVQFKQPNDRSAGL
ncbi:hypothetical protein E2C01_094681 [Portunus trituberculatus]|uniref:Uncharacterized protein n=1 Tax=Portunus trituberculatus TaxID=210409 RepID=A0A5B7K1H7_PORTR|nr:hypothetical protein [Portunus trituberculatus]